MNDQQQRELSITRLFKASRDLMFDLWTNPEHIKHWWGPDGFTNTILEMDVKPGGKWEFIMHGPDGKDYKNKSTYVEVVRPERIVFDHVAPNFRMTVDFTEQGEDTLVSITSVFESARDLQNAIKTNKADEGLKQNMDRLDAHLAAQPFIIERTYHAPAAMVWSAITEKEQMKQWYFDLADFKAEVGFEFDFTGGPDDRQYKHLCKVTEVVPGSKLTYSWRYDGYAGNSFVTFELFPEGDKTRLKLTHSGLHTFPAHPDFARANFAMGWNQIIGQSLPAYLQKA